VRYPEIPEYLDGFAGGLLHPVARVEDVFDGVLQADGVSLYHTPKQPVKIGVRESLQQQFVVKGIAGSPIANSLPSHPQMVRKSRISLKTVLLGQSGQHLGRKTIFGFL
jgi:hypothetical protein